MEEKMKPEEMDALKVIDTFETEIQEKDTESKSETEKENVKVKFD